MGKYEKEEWFLRVRDRYIRADRPGKKQLLDEITDIHGMHRKTAIRLLKKRIQGRNPGAKKRGPKSQYDNAEFLQALRLVWKQTDYMCSKLFHAAMPDWVRSTEKHYGVFSEEIQILLGKISAPTIDRKLKPYKVKNKGGTKPGSLLKNQIPIQGSVWDIAIPGFLEADTVAHCGNSIDGQFAWSLTLTDICTQWTECRAVWHKGAEGVVAQIKDIETSLPFKMRGFDCDNGSEFLNNYLLAYFSEKKQKYYVDFTFTRSRPYHKNDNAHVEQRNWTHPRRLYSRDRLDFWELIEPMNDLYKNEFSMLRNHFFPTLKLDRKLMIKSRYKRIYGDPKTPYLRVMESEHITPEVKFKLQELHNSLDPIELMRTINIKLKDIYGTYKRLRKALTSQSAA